MVSTFVTQTNTALSIDATSGAQERRFPISMGPEAGGAVRAVIAYLALTSGASNQVNNASARFEKLWSAAGNSVKIGTFQRVTAHSVGLGGSAVNGNTASAALIAGSTVVNGTGVTAVGNGSTAGTSVFELYLSEPAGLTELVINVPAGILTGSLVIRTSYEH